ncbi:fungal-specific transcription factor domain-containing protein [Lipomyces orientalis]|uniref:Fungal-specific transcription factor domain-containing protein n=1 Tax=Lipomyces orientalis TaxID=1233043 RepID=A0ACC3TFL7_9ASCO
MSPTKGAIEANGRRNRRAPMACNFCRRRKMKCDNQKPNCQNCEAYNKDCVYVERAKKPRPSNALIDHLEKENRRLQEVLRQSLDRNNESKSQEWTHVEPIPPNAPNTSHIGLETHLKPQIRVSEKSPQVLECSDTIRQRFRNVSCFPSVDKESRYHGPTSAMFDEKSTERGIQRKGATDAQVSEECVKSRLMAEATKQRQLETVHLATSKLDFDGIDPSLGMHLLSIYFNRQHDYGMVVYRPAFMRDMACKGPYFSKLLLNAIYFAASKHSARIDTGRDPKEIPGWVYRQRFVELLSTAFEKSEITTIQALIIIASPLFMWCDERSTSWLYAGIAFDMIIDLGIHVDVSTLPNSRRLSDEDLEVRRRIFWGAYVKDKVQSLYQGRPARLREIDTNVPLTFLDEYEELEQFNTLSHADEKDHPGFPLHSISTFKEECRLGIIMDRIIGCLYSEKSPTRSSDYLLREAMVLHDDLKAWRIALPAYLDFKSSESANAALLPHMFSLLAMYNVLVILLHRPFVSDGHLQSTSLSVAFDSFVTCTSAATEIDHILRAYGRVFWIKTSPYIISYATYVSATIHVRMAAQRQAGSEAHKSLQACLYVLNEHQQVCHGARRARRIIHSIMQRMGVVVDDRESVTLGHESSRPPQVTTLSPNQNDPDFFRDPSLDNPGGVEDASRMFSDNRTDLDLGLPDLDMDAIIQSFHLDQQMVEQSLQQSQFQPAVGPSSCALSPDGRSGGVSDSHTIAGVDSSSKCPYDVLQDSGMPILYDPIFGFNGSALDGTILE